MSLTKKYKVVDYGSYHAASTWSNIKGKVIASYDTMKEAIKHLKTLEKK
jgi:hypothetical protein